MQKGSSAVHYITGHARKINGIDWSPFNDNQFATCAHDCSVKVCCFAAVTCDSAGSGRNQCSSAKADELVPVKTEHLSPAVLSNAE